MVFCYGKIVCNVVIHCKEYLRVYYLGNMSIFRSLQKHLEKIFTFNDNIIFVEESEYKTGKAIRGFRQFKCWSFKFLLLFN